MYVHLLALEQDKKIHDYETKNVFKYGVVVGSTLVLFIDGNPIVTSFPSRKNTSMKSFLKLAFVITCPFSTNLCSDMNMLCPHHSSNSPS
jgi:hypothetical protein